jgi:Raf kinase inhibitor-like YbhB/YbcL family protein
MLEKLPSFVGRSLRKARPGLDGTVVHKGIVTGPPSIILASDAFVGDGVIARKYTADGDGISPPLAWSNVPGSARAFALIVEDADSPTPKPLVHAIVAPIGREQSHLAEGEIAKHHGVGRNSYMRAGWLPPDPPPGHGPHRYVFQLFALATEPKLDAHPGRGALIAALRGNVLAHGIVIATYERDGKV